MADKAYIARMLSVLVTAYPNNKLEPAAMGTTIELWHKFLSDLEPDLLDLAIQDCIVNSTWFPSVHDIRAASARIATGADVMPSAAEAWGEFKRIIGRLGYYEKPVFPNPVMERTVQALGLRALMECENEAADRARFLETYTQFMQRGLKEATLTPQLKAANNRALEAMNGVARLKSGKE